jgi:hypothetical protein
MSGSLLAQWVIPIVVAVALFGWLTAVLHANAHPQYKHHNRLPRYEVTGGAFEANDGGRQLMPIPGGRPMADRPGYAASASAGIPAQRTASSTASGSAPSTASGSAPSAASGSAADAGSGQAAAGQPAVPRQRRIEPGQPVGDHESRLIAGCKLR